MIWIGRNTTPLTVGLLLGLLVAYGCTSLTAVQVRASAIATAKNADAQFLDTGRLMDSLVNDGKITWEQYRPWRAFSEKYKVVSRGINAGLNRADGDPASLAKSAADLAAELYLYFAFAQDASKAKVAP